MVWADPKGKHWVPLERVQKLTSKLKKLEEAGAAPVDTEALKAQVRAEVEAQYKPRLLALEAQTGLLRAGLAHDEEAAQEVMERYARVKPGEDGKVPDLQTWLLAQKEAKARWVKALLPDEASAPEAAPPAEAAPPKAPPARTSQPNGGAVAVPPPPARGSLWERMESLSYAERLANWDQLRVEGVAAGFDIGPKPGTKK
jgi:hypothetical protein